MGISKSTYPEWAGSAVAAGSVPFSDALLMQTILEAEENGEGDVDLLVSDYFQFRTYGNSLVADRRYGTSMQLPSGFRGIEVANAVYVPDRDTPAGTVESHTRAFSPSMKRCIVRTRRRTPCSRTSQLRNRSVTKRR